MDYDGGGSSHNEQYTFINSNEQEKRISHRHTPQQIQILEAYFKECPHPDGSQRQHLCNILKLEEDQIKFWFQNKRTQCKAQYERSYNIFLREENEKIQRENEVMIEMLTSVTCPPCSGPPFGKRERDLEKLPLENALLKEKRDKFANFVSNNKNGPTMVDSFASSTHRQQIFDSRIAYGTNPSNVLEPSCSLGSPTSQTMEPQQLPQMDITQLYEMAASAVEELKRLFFTEEAFWIKSCMDGTFVIDQNSYGKLPHAIKHLKNLSARVESSRDVTVVPIEAMDLIKMFLDSEKWKELFPTIVNKAKLLHVFGCELPLNENYNVLQVMWEQLHILSPLVPPREFMIIRCCQKIDEGLWIVADVSHNVVNIDQTSVPCYKRPSGCLIRALPNAYSEVRWIEHVEVDDKSDTHKMYRELLCGGLGYGARRWIITLERMCERMALSSILTIPATDLSEAITTLEGRSVMKLGERMLKNLNEMLIMSGKVDFPQYSKCGVRVSTRLNIEDGQPLGLIVSAASCLSIPLTPLHVFNSLRNIHTRHQWDVLCYGNIPCEIARVFTGSNETNCVSILRPTQRDYTIDDMVITQDTYKKGMLILQDCYMDPLGGMLVYAPLDMTTMNVAVSGQVDTSTIPILPSGFIISSDGRRSMAAAEDDGGTLLTVVYQLLVTGRTTKTTTKELNEKSVDKVSSLISSAVQRIKVLLNCPHV